MRSLRVLSWLPVAALLLGPVGAEAELFRWLAFGDSVTAGDFDNQNLGGYPGRLETHFGCTPSTCEVFNSGFGGERTPAGLSRIDGVLDNQGPFQVVLLMEGTNDIFRQPPFSTNTIKNNLNAMAAKARQRGAEPVHASIIWFHPNGNRGTTRDDEVEDLRDALLSLSTSQERTFVDVWDLLCPDRPDIHGHSHLACFAQHYYQGVPSPDPVGHPRGSGYTMMADLFHDRLTAVPAPGQPVPSYPTGTVQELDPDYTWARESPVRAPWYQLQVTGPSGTVIDDWYEARFFCTTTDCTVAWFTPLPLGQYFWRVRGRNPGFYGAWSPWTSFVIDDGEIFTDGFESGDTSAWSVSVP